MKYLKRVILTLLAILILMLGAVSAVAVWAYHHPKEAFAQVQSRFLPEDLKIDWDDLDLKIDHLSALNFKIDLNVKALSIEKKAPALHIPVQQTSVSVSIYPFAAEQKVIAHRLNAVAQEPIEIKLSPNPDEKPTNPFEKIQMITQKLFKATRWVRLENIDVTVAKLTLENEDLSRTQIDLSIQKTLGTGPEQITYKAGVKMAGDLKVNSAGTISFVEKNDQKIYIDTKTDVVSPELNILQNIKGTLGSSNEISSTGSFNYKKDKINISAKPTIKLKLDSKKLSIQLDTSLSGLPSNYVSLKKLQAQFDIPLQKNASEQHEPAQLVVNAPVQLFAAEKALRAKLQSTCRCEVPQIINVKIAGPIWLENILREDEKKLPLLDLKFDIETLSNRLLNVASQGRLQIERTGKDYTYQPDITFKAKILSFKTFSKVLDQFKILVPSPFDVLEGEVNLDIAGPIESTATGFTIPIQATTKLTSPNQVVDLTVNSNFDLKKDFKSANMDVHLFIHELQLEMPPLKPTQGNPRIVTDKRILLKPVAQAKATSTKPAFKLTLGFEVSTDKPGSIRLLAEYFKPYLPLTVTLVQKSGEKNVRSVRIEPFDIEYLRRKVKIENMNLQMGDNSDNSDNPIYIDGRLSVQQSLYKIYIDVHGLAKSPNIVLSSEPDLPRAEIINVLIYDRTSDQLASADVKTTGQIDAAMTDRAIGLFGIWAFAATPIRGFSYNPSTKVYAATVEISDGVTASIGTTWESTTQLAVQKRISRSWMLAASWTPADKDEPETTKLVLQWEKRVQ